MDWGNRFLRLLEDAFRIEHLSSPTGKSYGAGSPISAGDLLQSAISGEDIEHYPELLVDEWAAQHLIDREVGFETLVEFGFEESPEAAGLVQFVLLENEYGRSFLGRKLPGETLHFLVAVDSAARDKLVSATILAMMAAEAVFGEGTDRVQLPSAITNRHPEIVPEEILRKGIELMVDHASNRDQSSWDRFADRVGRPSDARKEDILTEYFNSTYSESERW